MTKSLLFTAAAFLLALPAGSLQADPAFAQDFSTSNNLASYVGTGAGQFDSITNGGNISASITGGLLSVTKNGATSGTINRTTPIPGLAGGAAIFQFDFNSSGTTANGTNNDILFQVGSGYTNITGAESTSTYAQFNIDLLATGGYSVGGLQTYTTAQTISFCLNNTGAAVTFTPPGGGAAFTLQNDNFALFVGGVNLTPGGQVGVTAASGHPDQDITQFKLRFPSTADNGTITVDNFNVTAVPEPSTVALLGAGAIGMIVAARRRLA